MVLTEFQPPHTKQAPTYPWPISLWWRTFSVDDGSSFLQETDTSHSPYRSNNTPPSHINKKHKNNTLDDWSLTLHMTKWSSHYHETHSSIEYSQQRIYYTIILRGTAYCHRRRSRHVPIEEWTCTTSRWTCLNNSSTLLPPRSCGYFPFWKHTEGSLHWIMRWKMQHHLLHHTGVEQSSDFHNNVIFQFSVVSSIKSSVLLYWLHRHHSVAACCLLLVESNHYHHRLPFPCALDVKLTLSLTCRLPGDSSKCFYVC